MKVTLEVLEKYKACKEGIDFLRENFPDGASILEISKQCGDKLPLDFVHFARKYLITTPEEIEEYNRLCDIKNSHIAMYGEHIDHCEAVLSSSYITDSKYVFDSEKVHDSMYIYNSESVQRSNNIYTGKNIRSSSLIVCSNDIADSQQISNSNYINWSKNILYSFLINESEFIYKSKNLVDCYFCGFLENCKHCLFCTGLKDEEYCIFNEKISLARFEEIKEALLFQLQAEFSTFIQIDNSIKANGRKRFIMSGRFDDIFNGLSEEFYGWVSTLPNYSDDRFLNLFFRGREFEK